MPVVVGVLGCRLDVLEDVFERSLVGEGHRDWLVELGLDRLGLGVAVEHIDGLAVLGDPPLGEVSPDFGIGIFDVLIVRERYARSGDVLHGQHVAKPLELPELQLLGKEARGHRGEHAGEGRGIPVAVGLGSPPHRGPGHAEPGRGPSRTGPPPR